MNFSFRFFFFLVDAEAFEGVGVLGHSGGQLGLEDVVEATHGFGDRGRFFAEGIAFIFLAAVLFGFRAAALVDGQNGVFVEDEIADTFDGELTSVRAEGFGFCDSERFDGFDTGLEGFFLGAQFAQEF